MRVTSGDWVLSADASTSTFSVDAGPLGRLLENGRFWVREESGVRQANGWIVRADKDALVIRTSDPKMEWKLSVIGDVLHIAEHALSQPADCRGSFENRSHPGPPAR